MMSLWDALRMNMMISYQELVRTFPREQPEHLRDNFMERVATTASKSSSYPAHPIHVTSKWQN